MSNEQKNEETNEENNNDIQASNDRCRRSNEISYKWIIDKFKDEGIVGLLLVNCNGFGPLSISKIDQLME